MLQTVPWSAARGENPFGAGGESPYDRALTAGTDTLELVPTSGTWRSVIAVPRFTAPADAVDLALLDVVEGSVLDVGCGPGRMLRAVLDRGGSALGIDTSATAVAIARAAGLRVLHASVFDALPADPVFGTVLLLDGNIGIGGDPARLLTRCAALLEWSGVVLVEVHPEPDLLRRYTAVLSDSTDRVSDPFAWADVGSAALAGVAAEAGLRAVAAWSAGERAFVRLERR